MTNLLISVDNRNPEVFAHLANPGFFYVAICTDEETDGGFYLRQDGTWKTSLDCSDTKNGGLFSSHNHAQAAMKAAIFSSQFLPARISIDGDQWCVLCGKNLQDGVAGFGDSPAAAMHDFDKAWNTTLETAKQLTQEKP